MPTFDYVCVNCGHRLEVLLGVNATGPTTCADCGGPLRRSFSPPTIHFKGSGWAKVDRRSASASRSSRKDADADAAPAGASGDDGPKSREGSSGAAESGPSVSSSEAAPPKTSERTKGSRDEGRATEAKPKASNAAE